jgi:hypothetical protein
MAKIISINQVNGNRPDKRESIDRFYCVEIDLGPPVPIYQFRVRDISGHRGSVLVNESSSILKSLTIGQKLKMNYWTGEHSGETKAWHAQIKHITKQNGGSLEGHFLVGFSIINEGD